jgi:hypothetical protein
VLLRIKINDLRQKKNYFVALAPAVDDADALVVGGDPPALVAGGDPPALAAGVDAAALVVGDDGAAALVVGDDGAGGEGSAVVVFVSLVVGGGATSDADAC